MTQIINNLVLSLPNDKEEEFFLIRNDICTSLVKTEKGHISNCLENFVLALQKDPVLKGSICLNLLTERVDILADLGWQPEAVRALLLKSLGLPADAGADDIVPEAIPREPWLLDVAALEREPHSCP